MNLLISLDGISHHLFRERYEELGGLFENHIYAKRLRTVNPSVTFPVHVSAVTGVWPQKHGIYENVLRHGYPYERLELYEPKECLATSIWGEKTLFHLLKENSIECRAVHWPLGCGLPCEAVTDRAVTHEACDSVEQARQNDEKAYGGLMTSLHMQEEDKPGFMAVHFVEYDAAAHIYGIENERTLEAFERYITYMKQIVKDGRAQGVERILFFSDHGLIDRTDTFFPNIYVAECGYREKLMSGQFRFLCDGSGSILYYSTLNEVEDEEILACLDTSPKVESVSPIQSKGGANPDIQVPRAIASMKRGVCAEDILPGDSPLYTQMRGIHGYHPACVDEMDGFLFLWGVDIQRRELSEAFVVDLAPTAAKWYGLTYVCDGKPLETT